jgi:transcriptional antiterminator NusG
MLENKVYWYVLFVQIGAEERLAEKLKERLGEKHFPFVPVKTCVFRRQGKKSLFQKPMFPGYLFIESNKPALDFMRYIFPIVYKQKEAYRFLCYGDKCDIAMRDEERIALSRILGNERKIDISIGFREGDSVRVISGPLKNNESKIVKINKNRNEAVISVPMLNDMIPVSVGIEFIEKITEIPMQ